MSHKCRPALNGKHLNAGAREKSRLVMLYKINLKVDLKQEDYIQVSTGRHAHTAYQVFKSTHVAVVYRSGWTDLAVYAPQHRVTLYTGVLRFTFSETGRGCIYELLIWTLSVTKQFTCIYKDRARVCGLLLVYNTPKDDLVIAGNIYFLWEILNVGTRKY